MKQFIVAKCNGLITTICDYLSNFFGGAAASAGNISAKSAITSPGISKHHKLSAAITSMLSGTDVTVYVYQSKKLNCFSFIGRNKTGTPLVLRYKLITHTLFMIPFLGTLAMGICAFIDAIIVLLGYGEMFNNAATDNTVENMKTIDDPNIKTNINIATKQAIIDANDINVYISSAYVEALDDDEIIAVLLHEVGHNAQILKTILIDLCGTGGILGLGVWLYIKLIMIVINNVQANDNRFNSQYDDQIKNNIANESLPILTTFMILVLLLIIVIQYFRRRVDVASDTFAVQLGYGPQLESALRKTYAHTHDFESRAEKISNWNIGDSILRFVTAIFNQIYDALAMMRLTPTPDRSTRLDTLHQKIEDYNGNVDQIKYEV